MVDDLFLPREAGKITRGATLRLSTITALVLLLAVLWLAASGQAGGTSFCGDVKRASAGTDVNPGERAPLAIGDSVMLLALPNLSNIGFDVNARGCRDWAEGLRLMKSLKRQGKLPHLVVVALGADFIITPEDVRRTLNQIGPERVLGLVVPRELGGGTSSDATTVRQAGNRYRKRVMVLDWVQYSRGHDFGPGKWFGPDRLHLTYQGAAAFARMFSKSLPYAISGEFPQGARFPARR
jgi:hypothetical protein